MKRFFLLFLSIFLFFGFCAEAVCAEEVCAETDNDFAYDKDAPDIFNQKVMNDLKNSINFVKDFLDDKKPIRIDFGAEPHQHGSTIFGVVQYDYTHRIGASFRLEYDNYSTTESNFNDFSKDVKSQSSKSLYVAPFPFIFYLGDDSMYAKSPALWIGLGAFYQYGIKNSYSGTFLSVENPTENDVLFNSIEMESHYQRIGPAIEYAIQFPFLKYFNAIFEGLVVPLYFSPLSTDMTTSSRSLLGLKSDSQKLFSSSVSSPILSQSLAIDVVRYFRFAAKFDYEVLRLSYASTDNSKSENSVSHEMVFRFGGEILKPAKNRKKTSHLRAGIYYGMHWSFNESTDVIADTRKDEIILCFGT